MLTVVVLLRVPYELFAMQVKFPSSSKSTLGITNVPSSRTLWRSSMLEVNTTHVIFGLGVPSASHLSTRLAPRTTVAMAPLDVLLACWGILKRDLMPCQWLGTAGGARIKTRKWSSSKHDSNEEILMKNTAQIYNVQDSIPNTYTETGSISQKSIRKSVSLAMSSRDWRARQSFSQLKSRSQML